jgi:hypothetical protein
VDFLDKIRTEGRIDVANVGLGKIEEKRESRHDEIVAWVLKNKDAIAGMYPEVHEIECELEPHFTWFGGYTWCKKDKKLCSCVPYQTLWTSVSARTEVPLGWVSARHELVVSHYIDVVISRDHPKSSWGNILVEVKTANEKWSAGDVIRQIKKYLSMYREKVSHSLLVCESITESAAILLDNAGIEYLTVEGLV